MGTSTVAQLIAKGKAENSYNNSGISSDSQWWDFFNDALRDLVEDINIVKALSLTFDGSAREIDLPSDYYNVVELYEANGTPVCKRRIYGSPLNYSQQGYFVMYRGSKWVIDLYYYTVAQTLTGLYVSYPTVITGTGVTPEIPAVGEKALIYYALEKALRNNNQVGMADEMKGNYERERKKIRAAVSMGAM
jgi:hypothetical protein